MTALNEFSHHGRTLVARDEVSACDGCVGANDMDVCDILPACTDFVRTDGRNVIWIDPAKAKPAPTRLTKAEIDALKQRAIDQYGATWLHEFGSFVEAEVYARLGVELPSQAPEGSGDAV